MPGIMHQGGGIRPGQAERMRAGAANYVENWKRYGRTPRSDD
jgi:hypothetical protein